MELNRLRRIYLVRAPYECRPPFLIFVNNIFSPDAQWHSLSVSSQWCFHEPVSILLYFSFFFAVKCFWYCQLIQYWFDFRCAHLTVMKQILMQYFFIEFLTFFLSFSLRWKYRAISISTINSLWSPCNVHNIQSYRSRSKSVREEFYLPYLYI